MSDIPESSSADADATIDDIIEEAANAALTDKEEVKGLEDLKIDDDVDDDHNDDVDDQIDDDDEPVEENEEQEVTGEAVEEKNINGLAILDPVPVPVEAVSSLEPEIGKNSNEVSDNEYQLAQEDNDADETVEENKFDTSAENNSLIEESSSSVPPPPLPIRRDSVGSTRSNRSLASESRKHFKSWFNLKTKSSNASKESVTDLTSYNDTASETNAKADNYGLLLSRLHDNTEDLNSKSANDREQFTTGAKRIKSTFNEIRDGIPYDSQSINIDWEFWSKVVNDYSFVAENEPELLIKNISSGIPKELRGMVWQLIANSKSFALEQVFSNLKVGTSNHERSIKRDLMRTRFITENDLKDKIQEVFDIVKAYSLHDTEVGYTQGMAFIAVPLLMNMNESEAFCLLVTLMNNYNFRSLYLPDMPGLLLKLYQFDRLLEDLCPQLFTHLSRQGVRSSMYATQWFLTLFGYKFPLEIVLRIFDTVIAEGLETILKFSINFMIKNKDYLVTLQFDQLLEFLKDKLFYYYLLDPSTSNEINEITVESYRLDDLVSDSMAINILPITLKKYETEYEEIHRLEKEREEELETLRLKNGALTRETRKLESSYAILNKEHVEVANEMIQGKVKIANLEDENKELKAEIKELYEKLSELEAKLAEKDSKTEEDMNIEIQKTMQRNLEVMETNRLLEEQLGTLELQYNRSLKEAESLNNEHNKLKNKLRNLMR